MTSTNEKGQIKYLAAWKAEPRMLGRDFLSLFFKGAVENAGEGEGKKKRLKAEPDTRAV